MDQVCPRCKTTKYRNPNMKMMVNVCGHNLCESCVELLFVKGSGSCPECNIPLRRGNFRYTRQSTPYHSYLLSGHCTYIGTFAKMHLFCTYFRGIP